MDSAAAAREAREAREEEAVVFSDSEVVAREVVVSLEEEVKEADFSVSNREQFVRYR